MLEIVIAIAAALSGDAVEFFAVIGFFATLGAAAYFIGKLLDERKRNKLADESMRRLREERSSERREAEWRNMTTAGTEGGMLWPPTGEWVVLVKKSEGNYEAQPCGSRTGCVSRSSSSAPVSAVTP